VPLVLDGMRQDELCACRNGGITLCCKNHSFTVNTFVVLCSAVPC
jgi:hypothetical protein